MVGDDIAQGIRCAKSKNFTRHLPFMLIFVTSSQIGYQ